MADDIMAKFDFEARRAIEKELDDGEEVLAGTSSFAEALVLTNLRLIVRHNVYRPRVTSSSTGASRASRRAGCCTR